MRHYLNIEQYIIMASRKRSKNSNQPKLMEYVNHEATINSLLPIKDQIDKELLRLVKVRKEIECRRIEEDKIIRKILKLHIGDKKEEVKEQVLVEDEEYLVLTTEECLEKESNPSLLKLILGGYGALHMNKKAIIEVEETQEETFESEQTVKQWVEHGNLKPQLMTDYSKDFIHYLKEMQYVADQLNAETKGKRF